MASTIARFSCSVQPVLAMMGVMTRWLDPDEQRTWRAFLTASRALMDTLDRELQRDAGMPHAYYEILVRLSETPDGGYG